MPQPTQPSPTSGSSRSHAAHGMGGGAVHARAVAPFGHFMGQFVRDGAAHGLKLVDGKLHTVVLAAHAAGQAGVDGGGHGVSSRIQASGHAILLMERMAAGRVRKPDVAGRRIGFGAWATRCGLEETSDRRCGCAHRARARSKWFARPEWEGTRVWRAIWGWRRARWPPQWP